MRHPDDQPQPLGPTDWMLAKELRTVFSTQQRFYKSCDGALRSLLSLSEWGIVEEPNNVMVLLVMCPTVIVTDRLLKRCTSLANKLLKIVDTPPTSIFRGQTVGFAVRRIFCDDNSCA